jgi:hypothetical protein
MYVRVRTYLPYQSKILYKPNNYPTTFNAMASKDDEQGGGLCPPTKAGIPPSTRDHPSTSPTPLTKAKPTAVSTRSYSCSQSRSAARSCMTKDSTKSFISILEALNSKPKDCMKSLPDSFSQVGARPPSSDALKPTPAKLTIASAMSDLRMAIKKHQSDILSLLWSDAPGATVSASKIPCLRADNVAKMMTATIRVQ